MSCVFNMFVCTIVKGDDEKWEDINIKLVRDGESNPERLSLGYTLQGTEEARNLDPMKRYQQLSNDYSPNDE